MTAPESSTPRSTSDLEPIHGGFHVKTRDDGLYCIDVMQMLYNYRVVLSVAGHQTYVKGFCYYGHSGTTMHQAFLNAVAAAQAWDGYGEPAGYDKRAV